MQIGNMSNNINFGKIYQVIAPKKDMQQLRILVSDEKKATKNPAIIYNMTNNSAVPKSISDKVGDKQFCIVVTGENSLQETNKLSGSALSSFLINSTDKLIKIGTNVKKDAVEILQSIKGNK